jgi:hypothetical protein
MVSRNRINRAAGWLAAAVAALTLALAAPAWAQKVPGGGQNDQPPGGGTGTAPDTGPGGEITSTYTSVGIGDCPQIDSHRMGGSWRCPAIDPYDAVIFSEGDLRQFIRFEIDGRELGPIFMIPNFNYTSDTLEWRLADGEPFAVILRYFLDDQDGNEFQRLYVGRVTPREVCTVGYVTVAGNPDHNVDARRMADQHASSFACGGGEMLTW